MVQVIALIRVEDNQTLAIGSKVGDRLGAPHRLGAHATKKIIERNFYLNFDACLLMK